MKKQHLLIVNCDKKDAVSAIASFDKADVTVLTDVSFEKYLPVDVKRVVVKDVRDLFDCQQIVAKIDQEHPIDNIIGVDEKALWLSAYLRSYFNIGELDYEQSKFYMNKLSTKNRWKAQGLACTPCRKVANVEQISAVGTELGWPVILKRAYGAGTQFTFKLKDQQDFQQKLSSGLFDSLIEKAVPMMLESCIDIVTEYHIDAVVYQGRVTFASLAAYTAPCIDALGQVHGSYTINETHPHHKALSELNEQAIASLGLQNGVTHLEVFETKDGFILSEIANRPGGGSIPQAIAVQFDYDYWTAFFDVSTGFEPQTLNTANNKIVVRIQLPAKLGKIKRITARDEFLELDCVADANMLFKNGDTFQDRMTSVFLTGIVFALANDYDDVPKVINQVIEHYVLEIDTENT